MREIIIRNIDNAPNGKEFLPAFPATSRTSARPSAN